jgi:hypothetical protein
MINYTKKISHNELFIRLAACLSIFLLISFVVWYAIHTKNYKTESESKRDPTTQCLENVSGFVTVLIDRTDALTKTQSDSLNNIFLNIKKNIRKDEALIAYPIDAEAGVTPTTLTHICAPVTTLDASALTDNAKRIKLKFDSTFDAPLKELLDKLKAQKTENKSPIFEVLQSISSSKPSLDDPSSSSRRELIIFSDMLQNSRDVSLYNLKNTSELEKLLKAKEILSLIKATNFQDYSIKIYMIERCGFTNQQRIAKVFWESILPKTGAKNVKFLPMPTPQDFCKK